MSGPAETAVRGMTRDQVKALPVMIDVVVAARSLGIGRSRAYEMARTGEFPLRVLKLGRRYRVVTADLHRLLGIDGQESE